MSMREERIEILKMVADKKITVEEGERLLRALDRGEAEERESRSERFGHRHRGPFARGEWGWGDSFEGFGFKAQEFFENAFGSVFGDEYWFEGYEAALGPVEDLKLDGGTTIVLTNPRTAYKPGSADMTVRSSDDGRLHLEVKENGRCEVMRKENKIVFFCHDDAEVRVPTTIAKVKVVLAKGNAEVHDLPLPLEVRTLKGDVSVRQAERPFSVRTMKGNVTVDLDESYAGKSDASVMDGDIRITASPRFSGRVEAKVAKGDIRFKSEGCQSSAVRNAIFRTESAEFGAGTPDNHLSLRTMRGNITVTSREEGR
jgi:DUF4097 and DUF4098 domain-containing protein YvlB